jgi:hypothetical protein
MRSSTIACTVLVMRESITSAAIEPFTAAAAAAAAAGHAMQQTITRPKPNRWGINTQIDTFFSVFVADTALSLPFPALFCPFAALFLPVRDVLRHQANRFTAELRRGITTLLQRVLLRNGGCSGGDCRRTSWNYLSPDVLGEQE